MNLIKAFSKTYLLTCALINMALVSTGQTSSENYIHSIAPLTPVADITNLNFLSADLKIENISYLDGIGRLTQQVSSKTSPTQKDEIAIQEYDNTGRIKKNYLAFTDATTANVKAAYRANAATIQQSFYAGVKPKFKTNTNAFGELNYDNSPLDLIKEQSSPSPAWALNTGKTLKQNYGVNLPYTIIVWQSIAGGAFSGNADAGAEYYYAKELFAATVTNEENHSVTQYVDKAGKLICEQELVDASTSKYNYTYYVYNDFGELTCIIPPKVCDAILSSAVYNTTNYAGDIFLSASSNLRAFSTVSVMLILSAFTMTTC